MGIVTDDLDLSGSLTLILVGKVSARVGIFGERTNKIHNQPALLASPRNDLQQVEWGEGLRQGG